LSITLGLYMETPDLTKILLDWSSTFIRLSLHDFNRFARNAGLSLAQMNVLMHLYYQGPSEVTNFCEMMQITPAGASQMIERMVQQGMVQRAETPGDRRVRLVHLTDQGRQVVLESIAARQAWIDRLAQSLSPEDQERIALALQRLNEEASRLEIHP
jgi:DNA-binding MarR family transcriptional regulator